MKGRFAVRVALVLPDLVGGGAERVFLEIARGLHDANVDVDIVLVRDAGSLRSAVPSSARVVVLGQRHTMAAIPALRRYLRRERPDAVIAALTHANIVSVVAARLAGTHFPVVVTQHNTTSVKAASADRLRDKVLPLAARAVYRFADRVVAVSDGVAADLAGILRVDVTDIDVLYNPVISARVLDTPEPASHPWLRDRHGPVLLAVGRLTEQKDYPTMLHALARLPADHRLIVLGDGELRGELEQLATSLGVDDRVDFHGFVDNPYSFFGAADVFVLSSAWEGLPTVLIEALPFACGIVSTDCPSGPNEILEGGRWGRLVPPGDPEALAAAVLAELEQPHHRTNEAWQRFELPAATRRYVELVDAVRA